MLAGKPFMKAAREFYGILEKKKWEKWDFFCPTNRKRMA